MKFGFNWKKLMLGNGIFLPSLLTAGLLLGAPGLGLTARVAAADTKDIAPLDIKLPIPAFMGTPTDIPLGDRIEKPSDKPRPPFLAPKGCTDVALNKPVTSSDKSPITGTLDLVTDGDKESSDTSYVELHRRVQWVQIDLQKNYDIYAILVWHAHNTPQVYHSVIVQLADDPDFTKNVRTVFNNDMDNAAGLGIGTNKEYFETYEGKLIPVKGDKARYVRLYSKGSTFSALNRYTEVEVYGLPAQ